MILGRIAFGAKALVVLVIVILLIYNVSYAFLKRKHHTNIFFSFKYSFDVQRLNV